MIKFHFETIICPYCGRIQKARVDHTGPFNTYIHDCEKCNYTLMESDWLVPDDRAMPVVNTIQRWKMISRGRNRDKLKMSREFRCFYTCALYGKRIKTVNVRKRFTQKKRSVIYLSDRWFTQYKFDPLHSIDRDDIFQ